MYDEIITDLQSLHYDFRINDLDDTLEVYTGYWKQYDDVTEDIIRIEMRELGYGSKKSGKPGIAAMRESISKLGDAQRYNPIKRYFYDLDGKYQPRESPYIIPSLAKYFTNPDGCFSTWLFKWMVGSIAKVFLGERNPMLVLAGNQRIGKSTFSRWLCPIPDRFVRGSINPDNKDHTLRLATTFIWEADELGSTTKRADAEALKSFLTLNEIYERPPFKKYPIHKPVVTSFIGTANFDGTGILNDPTGTSRFLACEISHIDFAYSTHINPIDVWAEAYWYYKNIPNSWALNDDQKVKQSVINEQFEMESALADVIRSRFTITLKPDDFLTTQQIKDGLTGFYRVFNEQGFYNELSRVLTKMGLKKDRLPYSQGNQRGWKGIRKNDES